MHSLAMASSKNSICRTCMANGSLKSLFDTAYFTNVANNKMPIFEIVMECTSVVITRNDQLPSQICDKCIANLRQAYLFKKQCENAESILRSRVNECSTPSTESNLAVKKTLTQCCYDNVKFEITENPNVKLESVDYLEHSIFSFDNGNAVVRNNDSFCQFGCDKCGKSCSTEYEFYRHSENEHVDIHVTTNKTNICSFVQLLSPNNFKRKSKSFATELENINESSDSMNYGRFFSSTETSKPVESDSGDKFSPINDDGFCSTDSDEGRSKKIVKRRKHKNMNDRSDKAKRSYIKTKIRKESFVKNIAEKSYGCEACGRKFSKPEYVKSHSVVHTGECVCHVCYNSFSCSKALKNHLRRHSGETLSFICDHCGKSYSTKFVLQYHIRQKHSSTDKQVHVCEACNKSFDSRKALLQHSVRHGEKKCLCDECGRAFVSKNDLRKHARIHTDSKPFECPSCGKRFAQRGYLSTHVKSHTDEKPIKCTLCDRSFKFRHYLTDHMRTHTGERPYKCTICNKSFPYNKSLSVHRRTHSS